MPDIAVTWDNVRGMADWSFENGDLAYGNDLETSVLISLFTDRAISYDIQPPDGTQNRRGWWGDAYSAFPIGSYLWLLENAKKIGDTDIPLRAQNYCDQALQWLLDYNIAQSVSTQAFWLNSEALGFIITIKEPGNPSATTFNYKWAWDGLGVSLGTYIPYSPPATIIPVRSNLSNIIGTGFILGESPLQPTVKVGQPGVLGLGFMLGASILSSTAQLGINFILGTSNLGLDPPGGDLLGVNFTLGQSNLETP